MFYVKESSSSLAGAYRTLTLIYHASVRSVRITHGNAMMSLFLNVFQTIVFVMVFYLIFQLMGMRSAGLRGDFMMYILTGVFLFMMFNKTMGAVYGCEGPTSPMMKHRNMNTMISIGAAMMSSLYIQVLSLLIVLVGYHLVTHNVEIADPGRAGLILLLTWLSGAGIGMVFLAAKPWAPEATKTVQMIFSRINMFASGKMFVANTLPAFMLPLFAWNPLFHLIDQMRGAVFVNYLPRNTNLDYPLWLMVACLMIGLMGEFHTRRRASLSWSAGK